MQITLPFAVSKALNILTSHGYDAFVVGGCVRDALLGLEPHDWDIATSALPQQVLGLFPTQQVLTTGLQHGTVTVFLDNMPLEITTFRIDGSYSDHRRPDSVTFSSHLKEDLSRRDFTVNALAYHPDIGLVDCFDGIKDLDARVLRCVGEPRRRFSEDALRILRLLRFASVLGFSIDPDSAGAARELAPLLTGIASERVREELIQLLCGLYCREILLTFSSVLGVILPEIVPCIGFGQHNPHHDFNLFTHLVKAVSFAPPFPSSRMAMLLHDISKPYCLTLSSDGIGHYYGHAEKSAAMAEKILKRLRFSNEQQREIVTLIRYHGLDLAPDSKPVRRWMAKLTPSIFFDILALRRADLQAQRRIPDQKRMETVESVKILAQKLLKENTCLSLKDLAVNGTDLLDLGIHAGPLLGNILHQLLEAVLEERCPNQRETLLELAQVLKDQPS